MWSSKRERGASDTSPRQVPRDTRGTNDNGYLIIRENAVAAQDLWEKSSSEWAGNMQLFKIFTQLSPERWRQWLAVSVVVKRHLLWWLVQAVAHGRYIIASDITLAFARLEHQRGTRFLLESGTVTVGVFTPLTYIVHHLNSECNQNGELEDVKDMVLTNYLTLATEANYLDSRAWKLGYRKSKHSLILAAFGMAGSPPCLATTMHLASYVQQMHRNGQLGRYWESLKRKQALLGQSSSETHEVLIDMLNGKTITPLEPYRMKPGKRTKWQMSEGTLVEENKRHAADRLVRDITKNGGKMKLIFNTLVAAHKTTHRQRLPQHIPGQVFVSLLDHLFAQHWSLFQTAVCIMCACRAATFLLTSMNSITSSSGTTSTALGRRTLLAVCTNKESSGFQAASR
mmetsp:Transcript_44848/g.126663  ORF Transcript_44848/g.126663 Transcript_44848/m.126663 type:complete len:399 (-) Transcript_44848:746-1942(-)